MVSKHKKRETRIVEIGLCAECEKETSSSGLCSVGCKWDGQFGIRPTIARKIKRTDTWIEDRITKGASDAH